MIKKPAIDECSASRLLIPDGLVVLTFDDGCRSDVEFVAPLLRQVGFGATFFVNDPAQTPKGWNAKNHSAWEQIRYLHRSGFEIGNHTAHHCDVSGMPKQAIVEELSAVERLCAEHGIPRPCSFCYPNYSFGRNAIEALKEKGYRFARRGAFPECCYDGEGQRGMAYDPRVNSPLLIPTTGSAGPHWKADDLVWAINEACHGKIAVLCFHGVPDVDHPWVHTTPRAFKKYLQYLYEWKCIVIAMRDLIRYVDILNVPSDPLEAKDCVTKVSRM